MSTFLSRDVQQGLDRARADELKRKSRFRVQFDGEIYPILKLWGDRLCYLGRGSAAYAWLG